MQVGHDDVIHADYHGAVVVPADAVKKLPAAIDLISRREKVILDFCRSPDFTPREAARGAEAVGGDFIERTDANSPTPLAGRGRGEGAPGSRTAPAPQPSPARAEGAAFPLLAISCLRTVFRTTGGDVAAVDGVDISVGRGRTLGIVGESGCGKSVLSLSVMRLVPPPGRIAAGQIMFDGRNLLDLSPAQMRDIRGNRIAMIFQEPMTSLNPGVHRRRPDHRGDARA